MKKYLSTDELLERYDITKSTLWRWHKEKDFPKPDITGRPNKFRIEKIERWEASSH